MRSARPAEIMTQPLFFFSYLRLICQVSPAQPTGGRRRRTVDDDPDERRQRFLERNRAAASRCRQKRKLWVFSLEKKAEELGTLNISLSVSGLALTFCCFYFFYYFFFFAVT